MEALYLNKPVVTIKGINLRSNHSAAILKKLELDELIAENYSKFLNLIKTLNENDGFYKSVVSKIDSNKNLIFNEKVSLYEKIKNII